MKTTKPQSLLVHDQVSRLIEAVREGQISGDEFCAEVSRLNSPDRRRLLDALLREYKDVNNFNSNTAWVA
jgi:hypothetical protein